MSAGEKGAGEKGAPAPAVVVCASCPRRCRLAPGALGACRARRNVGGRVVPEGYGRLTSLALDPVEKKPLARWRPGSYVVSVGSYGCNLACPFCQNHDIAQAGSGDVGWREVTPDELVEVALEARRRDPRVVGIAHTYNEPLVGWEYVRDCARLAREAGLANVLVSNGCACDSVLG
ncbi:MAG TPA: radical SAM protein, partial [Candidatus Olsenella avistercoris]|nr:radical SAM protein [Candidatus Olsenella avistercoris]